ncbi:MAG: SDR family oxidoreductase [Pseudomonadota bacterium]|nr:SDR family oxidoreductase [Pseudomonadota bacterium]
MSLSLFDLGGQVALVTGSTSGLGREIARGLAEAGATVIVNGRNAERLEATVEWLRGSGRDAHGFGFDVTEEPAIEAAVSRIEAEIGPIGILVSNAGIQRRGPLIELPQEVWEDVLKHDLTSVFLVGRTVARGMIERRRGKIINIASLASEVSRKTIGPYTAAKGGVRQLTKTMCIEWAEHNIQVNAIGPGYFKTELNASLVADPAFDQWVRGRTPAGRWGDPSELIGAAIFLASAGSDFMNGQVIYVDGGVLASM